MVTLEFQVVDKLGKNLLGLPDSLRLGIVHLGPEVYEVNTSITPELEVYKDLFDHTSIGKLPIMCKLEVDCKCQSCGESSTSHTHSHETKSEGRI